MSNYVFKIDQTDEGQLPESSFLQPVKSGPFTIFVNPGSNLT